eukprot:gene2973-4983_t
MGQHHETFKLITLGTGCVGKSTLLTQLENKYFDSKIFCHGDHKYSFDEKKQIFVPHIYKNLVEVTTEIGEYSIKNNEKEFEHEKSIEYITSLIDFQETIGTHTLNTNKELFNLYKSYFPVIWNEKIMQKNLTSQKGKNCDEYQHFISEETLSRLQNKNYIPTVEDVLHCRRKTTGITEFKFKNEMKTIDLYDTGGERNERKKWKNLFPHTNLVIYVISLSNFDENVNDSSVNAMDDSLEVFETIINSQELQKVSFLILFNKKNVLEKKLKSNDYFYEKFPEFKDKNEVDQIEEFIIKKFKSKIQNEKSPEVLSGNFFDSNFVDVVFEKILQILEHPK